MMEIGLEYRDMCEIGEEEGCWEGQGTPSQGFVASYLDYLAKDYGFADAHEMAVQAAWGLLLLSPVALGFYVLLWGIWAVFG